MDFKRFVRSIQAGRAGVEQLKARGDLGECRAALEALEESVAAFEDLLFSVPLKIFGFDLPVKTVVVLQKFGAENIQGIVKAKAKLLEADGRVIEDVNVILEAFGLPPLT